MIVWVVEVRHKEGSVWRVCRIGAGLYTTRDHARLEAKSLAKSYGRDYLTRASKYVRAAS